MNNSRPGIRRRQAWLCIPLWVALAFASTASADRGPKEGGAGSKGAPVRVETADRFDWADAAVGAGVATGLLVVLTSFRKGDSS